MASKVLNLRNVRSRKSELDAAREKKLLGTKKSYDRAAIYILIFIILFSVFRLYFGDAFAVVDWEALIFTLLSLLFSCVYAWFAITFFTESEGRSIAISIVVALMMTVLFSVVYSILGLSDDEGFTFLDHLYFTIVTMTTLGYGDITPSDASKGVAAVNALFGFFFFAILIAKLMRFSRVL